MGDKMNEKMNLPVISIIIPTKNSKKTIETCLKSIRTQTYQNIEIIVVDKNSMDSTIEIARKYDAKVFCNSLNKPAARNYGVSKANSDYIFLLDSDLELTSKIVEKCLEKAKEGYHGVLIPEVPISSGFWGKCKQLEYPSGIDINCFDGENMIGSLRFIKKNIYKAVGGFDEEINYLDDRAFFNRVRDKCKIGMINAIILTHEPILPLKKSFYQGKEYRLYRSKYKNKDNLSKSLRFRLNTYLKLLKIRPIHFFGILVIKSLKYLAFGLGFFSSSLLTREHRLKDYEEVSKNFDILGKSYEKDYHATLGGRYVDRMEKAAVIDFIKTYSPQSSGICVDLGVGTARWSREFIKMGYYVVGVDISKEMSKVACDSIKSKNFVAINANIKSLPLKSRIAEVINCFRVIKYVPHYKDALREMHRVLAEDGILVIEIHNKLWPFYLFLSSILPHIRRLIYSDLVPHYERPLLFSFNEFKRELENVGFEIVETRSIFFLPLISKINSPSLLNVFDKIDNFIIRCSPKILPKSFIFLCKKS